MRRTLILATALLVACSPADEDASQEVLSAYQSELDELQEAVDTYVDGAGTAAEVAAVSTLQVTYDADAEHAMGRLEHDLDDIEGCQHMGDGGSSVMHARMAMQAVREAIEDVLAAHLLHSDVADCRTLADEHAQIVGEELSEMADHHDDWTTMTCGMHGDDHME